MTDDQSKSQRESPITDEEADEITETLDGTFTVPRGMSKIDRRRLLASIGAGGSAAIAGCFGLFEFGEEPHTRTPQTGEETPTPEPDDDDSDEPERPDYSELDHMVVDWAPKDLVKPLNVNVAYNDEEIIFRFTWEQPDPGGWFHDMLVYEEGEWKQFASPDPWAGDTDYGNIEWHRGFYEDRLSFFLDDGSVQGFENFGGWLTVHKGVADLPGSQGLSKYIPQTRAGDWWEDSADDVLSEDELDQLKADGVFLDLAMWRSHRSNPMGYGTNHHVFDDRLGDEGTNTYTSQEWDPETGPEYMFDPDVVEDGTLDLERLQDGDYRQDLFYDERDEWLGSEEPYYLADEWIVEFDPEIAEQEGAAIPRRLLQDPEGSAADWRARGTWDDGEWTVVMRRNLTTDQPADTKQLEAGEVYDWAPAIHHGAGARWHWVAYPYKLGLGVEPDHHGENPDFGNTELVAEEVDGEPNWGDIQTYTIPLMYPGQTDWTWLTSGNHPRVNDVRSANISIWEHHPSTDDPESFADRMISLEEREASRD